LEKLKYFWELKLLIPKFKFQQKYITDLLKETGKAAHKPASILVDPNTKLGSEEDGEGYRQEMYQRLTYLFVSHYNRYCFYCEPSKPIDVSTKGSTFTSRPWNCPVFESGL